MNWFYYFKQPIRGEEGSIVECDWSMVYVAHLYYFRRVGFLFSVL